ncbi:MAG: hypothetical protein IPN08_17525 [Bacteroidales bacterium]|nr:hypothetical protein [Bacteroidales bacterium]
MKKLTIFILTIFPLTIWAHQDKYYTYEYDNVTVRFITGFFFEEINNAKIIGKYAALLSESMDYDEPVLLDFIHDYGHTYQGKTFSFLNIGSEDYELVSYYRQDSVEENVYQMVPYSDSVENLKDVIKEVDIVTGINQQRKIVIRQFGFHFDITQTLNLLYYAIKNKADVTRLSRTDTLSSYLRNMYYRLESVSSSLIDSIKYPVIPHVERTLQYKVYREEDSIDRHQLYYSYFSKNGKFFVFAGIHDKEIILDTLNQVYSFNPIEYFPELLFVFETPDQMRKYDLNVIMDFEYRRSQKHKIPVDKNEYIMSINIEWLGDDIYLINYYHDLGITFKRLFYLEYDDVLIEDFDSYIKSYRKERN